MDALAAVSRLAHPTTWATIASTLQKPSVTWGTHPVRNINPKYFFFLVFVANWVPLLPLSLRRRRAARRGAIRHREPPCWLWTKYRFCKPRQDQDIPTLTSLGSNLGGMLPLWSSAQRSWWGCRMNPEPGRPITVAPSPLKGRKKGRRRDRGWFYRHRISREFAKPF